MENTEGKESIDSPELTTELAANLLVYSFHLSQGSNELQGFIFQYLHHKYPNWKISNETDDQFKKIAAIATPIAKRFALAAQRRPELDTVPYKLHTPVFDESDQPMTEEKVENTIKEQLKIMQILFGETYRSDKSKAQYIQQITRTNMVMNSNLGQTLSHLNRKIKEQDDRFAKKGRQVKYYQKYIIDRQTTRIPIYDTMMQDIRDFNTGRSQIKR